MIFCHLFGRDTLFLSWQSPYARVTFAAKAILSHFRQTVDGRKAEAIFTTDHHLALRARYDAMPVALNQCDQEGQVLDFLSSDYPS